MKRTSLIRFGLAIFGLLTVVNPALTASIAQQAYLKGSNNGAHDNLGISVAVSGDTVVVGAPYEDSNATGINGDQNNNSAPDSGAAYVFVRNGTTWTQQAYLKASNTGAGDYFGYSVAVSGDTVVVGAWRESSDATGVNGDGSNNRATRSGAAYLFVRNGTNWTQQAYLKASNTGGAAPGEVQGDYFGLSVAVSGDTVVVGATGEDSNATGVNGDQSDDSASFAGAAYVFVRTGTTWTQQAYLKASTTVAFQSFGASVAVSGNTVVVGGGGAANLFVRSGTNWTQQAHLMDGGSVGVSGDTLATGGSEAANVFVRSGTNWIQQAYLKASNAESGDSFGYAVAVSGDTVVIGALFEDSNATGVNGNQSDNSATNSGAAYVFVRSGTNWSQQAYLKASNTGAGDFFGGAVAVSSDTVVIGAGIFLGSSEDSNATGVNGDQANNGAPDSGAAYIFTGLGTPTALPALKAIRSGDTLLLTWPASVSGAVLESTASFPAAAWTPVPIPPVIIGDQNAVTVDIEGAMKFYRLRKP